MTRRFGSTELPAEQEQALRRAVRLAWLTIGFLVTAIVLMYLVMGSSQAMRTAWAEDLLSLIPPTAFLVATHVTRRRPSPRHPYGYHRSVGVGHLVAGTALLTMGALLVWESASSLLAQEHPPVGVLVVLDQPVWSGWLMIAVLAYTAVPPVLLGRAKLPLARTLHDRVLYADADMNRADWLTAVAGIVGVLGIGVGLWWADATAALVISFSILKDGVSNVRTATVALMDARATTVDGDEVHPLVAQVDAHLAGVPWVADGRVRLRDEGHVFHAECFVVPRAGHAPTLEDLTALVRDVSDLDWKLQDVVVAPVPVLPEELESRTATGGDDRSTRHDAA
ncbi:cation transporter [Cellulomonas sp. JZ18]|uniref:cation diffusion facilitator family transporter n=1 Tax=Cellulomonas sp. JZ18 TaxID=2654191 RepID=UPI0012D3C711|nr:cation diffusion facilitator family transporter [Cellulomonas sp. JZ18]QGQ19295.1 cation transporter [Cellulomonas sp. JZ18]